MPRNKGLRKKSKRRTYKRQKKPVAVSERPAWNGCNNDFDKYKLTRTE